MDDDVSGAGHDCPACGGPVVAGERFCETCGVELTPFPAAACAHCGQAIAGDGYCGTCGAKAVSERDHWFEAPSAWVAAVCDRGIRHERNEDALAVAADEGPGGVATLVVCDGVSSADESDIASLAAARAALGVLADGGRPGPDTDDDARAAAWGDVLVRAVAAAQEAAVAAAYPGLARATAPDPPKPTGGPGGPEDPDRFDGGDGGEGGGPDPTDGARSGIPLGTTTTSRRLANPPSCTFVAAVVDGDLVVTGSIGDSRAYWLPDGGPALQLTSDDSWAAEEIARGVSRAEAESGPHAHAITRWLGVDSPDPSPWLVQLTIEGPGWIVVCSDGLWNYCSDAADLADTVAVVEAKTGRVPLDLADGLVAWANEQGGHDNISVALARLGEPEPEPPA